jgi:hypothetical protein
LTVSSRLNGRGSLLKTPGRTEGGFRLISLNLSPRILRFGLRATF